MHLWLLIILLLPFPFRNLFPSSSHSFLSSSYAEYASHFFYNHLFSRHIYTYLLLISRVWSDFVIKCNKSDVHLPFCASSLFSFFFFWLCFFAFSRSSYFVSLSRNILGRFNCCGSVTHGDGSYTKRISPADRTGSGSTTLPLLRSLKLVPSFRPAPFVARVLLLSSAAPCSFGCPATRKDTLNTRTRWELLPHSRVVSSLHRHFTT